ALEKIVQKGFSVCLFLLPQGRIAGLFFVKVQIFLSDVENGCGEVLPVDLLACLVQIFPVNLRSVCIGIDHNVAHLADAESAVEEMLKGMEDQVQKVICIAHGINRNSLDLGLDLSLENIPEHFVQFSVSL